MTPCPVWINPARAPVSGQTACSSNRTSSLYRTARRQVSLIRARSALQNGGIPAPCGHDPALGRTAAIAPKANGLCRPAPDPPGLSRFPSCLHESRRDRRALYSAFSLAALLILDTGSSHTILLPSAAEASPSGLASPRTGGGLIGDALERDVTLEVAGENRRAAGNGLLRWNSRTLLSTSSAAE